MIHIHKIDADVTMLYVCILPVGVLAHAVYLAVFILAFKYIPITEYHFTFSVLFII